MNNNNSLYQIIIVSIIILCIPAFLLNLHLLPFIGDEAIRSLVALEMMLSGNYLAPTMKGDFYFAKPPLYNWILIIFFKAFGQVNEFVARFPTVVFTFMYTWIIYWFNKNRFNERKYAVLLALAFLTCGRMIFYDSFLGLIDIFFSMVTYTMMIAAYNYAEKGRFNLMYFIVYGLSLMGFMLKGLPTLHFLIFTLIIIHYLFGSWKYLLSKYHLISIFSTIAIISLYFYFYNQYFNAEKTIAPLVDQAARRTILHFGFIDMIKHIITYPFENIFHFFPWSIMGLLLFQKGIAKKLKENRYIWFNTLCFISNFIIYWISPEVYPRYILMLIPLIFTVWIYLYEHELGHHNLRMNIISWLFKGMTIIVPILILSQWNHIDLKYIDKSHLKLVIIAFVLFTLSFGYFKLIKYRPFLFVIYLLVLRISFNIMILPIRAVTGDDEVFKREGTKLALKYRQLKLYKETKLDHINAFYITNIHKKIIDRSSNLQDSEYFIIDSTYQNEFVRLDSFSDALYCGTRWVVKGTKE